MSTDYSFLFPKKFSPNANLLFATRDTGITLGTPDRFSAVDCWVPFTGTDTLTGFSVSDLAALPLAVRPVGGVSSNPGGYAVYAICHVFDPSGNFPTYDQAGFNNNFDASIAPQTIEGLSLNALSTRIKNTGNAGSSGGFQAQIWRHLYRDLTLATGDLPELCYEFVLTLPDLSTLTDSSNRTMTLFDIKSRGSSVGQGDQRDTFGIFRSTGAYDEYGAASGTIGWYCQGDSRGNTEVSPAEDYFRYKNYSVSVPVNEPFKLRIYRKRAATFADVSTGRFRVEITKADGSHAVLFDCTEGYAAAWNAAHPTITAGVVQPARNISKGKFGRWVQAIFLPGVYFGGKANQDVTTKTAAFNLWDGYPDVLPDPAI
ncbi:hypothetical protein [Nitrosomonas oligotropha]|uniref:hypothetical protein n=1 Tax=Nitrosomonas oligotropha TaxID=42354 RepID=UPI0013716A9D|nr:hypothetical protein [Nitrosomonas oligotropha]MXS81588.1 hypothetical protein [Nitrosomonas oligotropha]